MNNHRYPAYIRLSGILICIILLGYLTVLGKDLLTPLAFSGLLAILLIPVANFLEKKIRLPRGAAAGLTLVGFIGLIILVFYVLGGQISDLSNDYPAFKKQLLLSFTDIQNWVSKTFHINTRKQLVYINSTFDSFLNSGSSMIGSTLLSISSMVLSIIFVLLYTLFLLIYRGLIRRFLTSLFKEENAEILKDIIQKTQAIIQKYITGLLIELSIVASVISLAFWAMGIKYAFLLGLIAGIFNLIPYIGMATALLLSVLITFANATGVKLLLVVITFVAVHLVDANVLLPLVVGSKVKINALMTIIGVVVGEMIWGIPGMFLSIPFIAVLKIIFDRIESLKPWGILLGEDEKTRGPIPAKTLSKKPSKVK